MERLLGQGAFGRVFACADARGRPVAVKVSKPQPRARRQAEREAEVLRQLVAADARLAREHCTWLLDSFELGEAFCLVFEPLSRALADVLKQECGMHGLLLADIRSIARDLLAGLAFMHRAGLCHLDVKCGNVMLRDATCTEVRHPRCAGELAPQFRRCEAVLIDFGGALEPNAPKKGRPGARQIWSPEICLGIAWDAATDSWSVGCLLGHLYDGERLFGSRESVTDDVVHLLVMERLVGCRLPRAMTSQVSERVAAKGVVFDDDGVLKASPDAREMAEGPTLAELVLPRHQCFLDLVLLLLTLDPAKRPHAQEVPQQSPFISGEVAIQE